MIIIAYILQAPAGSLKTKKWKGFWKTIKVF